MAVKSKAIIAAFYDRAPRFSYWTGCSTGGRQALMEAQRYPDDFDGIIAGAPANNQTQLCAWRIAVEARTLQDPASVVPVAKLALVNRAVLAACDALDGVTDRLLTDPHQCHFDPATILCRGVDRDDCLTARQVEAVKMGYAPATRRTGELIYPGLVPGGEMGWAMLTGAKPEPGGIDVGMFRFVAHEDPAWDWRTFDLDRDTSLVEKKAGFIDAVNPDLSAFRARGGKLLIYHGWNDGGSGGAISPQNSVNYYSSVLARMGPKQEDWLRLFMVPGMAHCGDGPGPNQVNWMAAMERWRESGIAPDRLIASRVSDNRVNMTRPICPYPQVAHYNGVGSTNDAANFACKVPDLFFEPSNTVCSRQRPAPAKAAHGGDRVLGYSPVLSRTEQQRFENMFVSRLDPFDSQNVIAGTRNVTPLPEATMGTVIAFPSYAISANVGDAPPPPRSAS